MTSFAFFSFLFLYFVARLNPSRVLLLCDSWNTLLPHSLLPDSVQALKILLNLIVFVYLNSHFKTLLDKLFSFLPFNELLDFNRWLFALLILLLVHAVASLNQLLVGAQQGCLPLCIHGSLVLCLPVDLLGLILLPYWCVVRVLLGLYLWPAGAWSPAVLLSFDLTSSKLLAFGTL